MTRPVLFLDLDDTILRFGPSGVELWEELIPRYARHHGIPEPALRAALDRQKSWYWSEPERSRKGRLDMVAARREIVGRAFRDLADVHRLGADAHRIAEHLADEYTWTLEERVAPLPGAVETLERWRGEGRQLALLTNGSGHFQRRKIERHDLEGFFDLVLIEGELGFGKPDPRVFRQAMNALGVAPEEAWMVGDNLSADVAGAQAHGIHAVWIDRDGRGIPEDPGTRPDRVVDSLAEVAALLDEA